MVNRPALTVGDLMAALSKFKRNVPVWIGLCDVCDSGVLSLVGPVTNCPSCKAETTVKPLRKPKPIGAT